MSKAQNYLALSDNSDPRKLESVHLDYAQTLLTYRMLADIRFKLLAFIPVISGIAITLLSRDVDTLYYHPQRTLVISVLGFVVTLGLAIYDQRNSQIHDATISRAQFLEDVLTFPARKGHRGHTNQRKEAPRRLFKLVEMWHDRGLAWIYGAVLGAWWFPLWYALIVLLKALIYRAVLGAWWFPFWYALIVLWEEFTPKLLGLSPHTLLYLSTPSVAGILAALTAMLFIYEFGRLEGRPKKDKNAEGEQPGQAGTSEKG